MELCGQGISRGLAAGKAFLYRDILEDDHASQRISREQMAEERARVAAAVEALCQELDDSAERIAHALNHGLADVFRAHQVMLRDAKLGKEFRDEIERELVCGEEAVKRVLSRWESKFRELEDGVLSQRADDVADLSRRLLSTLSGRGACPLADCPPGSVVVAERLLPSDTVHMSRHSVVGVAVAFGGPASHAALLTRELGIPAVAQLPELTDLVSTGDTLLVNGDTGRLVIEPDADELHRFEVQKRRRGRLSAEARRRCHEAAETKDGLRVEVAANIGCREDAEQSMEQGADGIGLYRIEQLYLARASLPSEDELEQAMRHTVAPLGEKPITVRLLDVGGDKNIPFLNLPHERNPFLGRRGVRFLLAYPALLKTQLRVTLRLSTEFNIRIMVPMVTVVEDMVRLRGIVEDVASDLQIAGLPPVGTMIETPSAALCVEAIAKRADFLSVGTNDLTQYTLVAGRENPLVADYFVENHPSVMRLIRIVCQESGGTPVSVCGELAGWTDSLPDLLQAGVRNLSVAPSLVPSVKETIWSVELNRETGVGLRGE
jgi:phosphotransferase system enzyme I (PtsI)